MKIDYGDIFRIDENEIDREWLDQPQLYVNWALKEADAREEHDRAKANLEVVMAEVSSRVRNDPALYIEGKVTEAAIEGVVLLDKETRAARDRLIKAKSDAEHYHAIVEGVEQKKKTLENLVHLIALGWRSEPQAKGNGREVAEELIKHDVRRRGRVEK